MIGRVAVLILAALAAACGAPVAPSQTPAPTLATVDGLPLLTVGEVLEARAAGGLSGDRVAVTGYWSDGSVGHSCAPPSESPGELELYCRDGEWGITQVSEPIVIIDDTGAVTRASSPHLSPFVPSDLPGGDQLFRVAHVRMPGFAPVPIVVVGHFDDPRAAECRPQATQLCLDRLVIERIVQLGAATN